MATMFVHEKLTNQTKTYVTNYAGSPINVQVAVFGPQRLFVVDHNQYLSAPSPGSAPIVHSITISKNLAFAAENTGSQVCEVVFAAEL